MQRSGPEPARGPSSKRVSSGKRSVGRRVAAVVASPLAAAAIVAALLLYSAHHFTHLPGSGSSTGGDMGTFFDGREGAAQVHLHGGAGSAAARTDVGSGAGAGAGAGHADALAALQGLKQQQAHGHPSSWLSAALLWAEEHRQARVKAKASVYQAPTGCGLLPCSGDRVQRPRTLVLYVYTAADVEQQRNFEFFMRNGVEDQGDWLTYRIVVAAGTGILPVGQLPQLPRNAAYVHTSQCSSGVWGILSVVAKELEPEVAAAQRIVVATSAARGPFMPPYTKQYMHWTDAFTAKLTQRTKLVGSALTCEGAPKDGDAAEEWRRNPFILPYAWATDKEGWQLLSQTEEVFKCHANPWLARYHSDAGAALALLTAGFNIDTLLAKYQGVDWWNQRTWDCNARVRPDAEWTYDGISITPYETVFVPISVGPAQSDWSYVRQALKYSSWQEAQTSGNPQGNSNAFVSDAWTLRAPRLIYANSRGPGCFDFDFYVQHNPDVASKASMHQLLWEHFVLVGQFQGRPHRFTCPVQIGNSYRHSYLRARGRRCFDHNHYSKHNQDLRFAGIGQAHELFNHYAEFGQFENRAAKYVCSDSVYGLPKGFDTRPLDPIPLNNQQRNSAKWQDLVKDAAEQAAQGVARLQGQAEVGSGADAGTAAGGAGAATETSNAQQQRQQAEQQQQAAAAAVQQAAAAAAAEQQQAQAAAAAAAAAAGGDAAAGQQGQAAGAAGGVQAAAQQVAAAGAVAGQGVAAGAAGSGQEAVGDAAVDAEAFGRLEESEVESFQRQEAVQQAAGGA